MSPAFWLSIQVGRRRVPVPLPLLLPVGLVVDILFLIGAVVYGIWQKKPLFVQLGTGFYLFRLLVVLMLYGGRFAIGVEEEGRAVRVFSGLAYPKNK